MRGHDFEKFWEIIGERGVRDVLWKNRDNESFMYWAGSYRLCPDEDEKSMKREYLEMDEIVRNLFCRLINSRSRLVFGTRSP